MTQANLQFQVAQLRQKNQQRVLESVAIFMLALFVTAILPSLLIRYVYAGQQLFEQPAALEYIPVISFVIGVAYFIYAMITNWLREAQASRLEREAMNATEAAPRARDLSAAMANVEAKASKSTRSTKAKRTIRRNR